jgi:RNA polymerase sigma factor FliA
VNQLVVEPTPEAPRSQPLEARFFPRARVDIPCEVSLDGDVRSGRFADLSEGGGRVMCSLDLRVGDVVDVNAGDALVGFAARGRVVRSLGSHDFGLAWVDLDAETSARLAHFLSARIQICWDESNERLPKDVALQFLPIVRRIARSFSNKLPRHLTLDDLVGAGFVALVEHQGRHRGLPPDEFERTAILRIRGSMRDELRKADPLSRRMRHRQREIARATTNLTQAYGRPPTAEEVASHLGLAEEAFHLSERLRHASSRDPADASAFDRYADANTPDPEQATSRSERLDRLRTAMGALPERLRDILTMHFGQDLTLREIGNIIGVTEARVCQLVGTAVKALKQQCVSIPPPQ